MPAAWREWLRRVLAAITNVPGGTVGAEGTAGADGSGGGSPEPAPGSCSSTEQPAPGPTYNGLVEHAIDDEGRTTRMDTLDRHRTDDHIRLMQATVIYCTGGVVVLVILLAGLATVLGLFHITSPVVLGPVLSGAMTLVVATGYRLGRLLSSLTRAGHAVIPEDRRAVAPDAPPASGPTVGDRS